MLSDNAFLRKIPLSLPRKDRLVFDGIAFAISAIGWAHEQLRLLASKYPGYEARSMDYATRNALFLNAWSMIDQAHSLRSLLMLFKSPTIRARFAEFCSAHASVLALRNKLDHLAQGVDNLSKRKGFSPPLFGVLSYRFPLEVRDDIMSKWLIVSLTSGALGDSHKWVLVRAKEEFAIEPPVGEFILEAFDSRVSLSQIYNDAHALIQLFDDVGEEIRLNISSECERRGLSLEQALKFSDGALLVFAEVHRTGES